MGVTVDVDVAAVVAILIFMAVEVERTQKTSHLCSDIYHSNFLVLLVMQMMLPLPLQIMFVEVQHVKYTIQNPF